MSCQQVPRIAEDPYMFTDSPIAATYFTSPVQKHSFVKSSENDFSRKLNRFMNKSNDSFNTNQRHNGPIYGKTTLSTGQFQSISADIISADAVIANDETSRVQKRTYRRLQSTNSITNTEVKAIANGEWETLKRKQSIKSLSPQPPLRPNTKRNINSRNQSNVSRTFPITFSNVIKSPSEGVDQREKNQRSHGTPVGQQQLKTFGLEHDKSNVHDFDSIKGVETNTEFGVQIIKKSISVNVPTHGSNVSSKSNGLNKLMKKQPIPEKKTKIKSEVCKKLINRRKSVSAVKYSVTIPSDEVNKQTALQRIPLKSTSSNEIASKKQINKTDSAQSKRFQKEWHAPESYIYDDLSADGLHDNFDVTSYTQTFWFCDIPNENLLTREQRLETKRDNLRRQAFQYAQAQHFRSRVLAKKRFITAAQALTKFQNERHGVVSTKCFIQSCSNTALAMTAYCSLHITLNKDQKLYHPCTAKFSDNSQCRVPVFDISHELPLCREHAWKRDNYNKTINEQKPKKDARSRRKSNESLQQAKRKMQKKKKKKKKKNAEEYGDIRLSLNADLRSTLNEPNAKKTEFNPNTNLNEKDSNFILRRDASRLNDITHIATTKTHSIVPAMNKSIITGGPGVTMYHLSNIASNSKFKLQNMLCAGEISSIYANADECSSTVILSDSELINASDGIEIPLGEARLLEEHDLTNVLNQLPEDAFNDLFEVQQSDHYEPTQREQDELARALEMVDEQVKSLEQMTGSTNFLENFLNVDDQILVDSS